MKTKLFLLLLALGMIAGAGYTLWRAYWPRVYLIDSEIEAREALLAAETAAANLAAGKAQLELDKATAAASLEIRNMQKWEIAQMFAVFVGISVCGCIGCAVSVGVYRKLSVLTVQTKNATIPVKYSDLSRLAPEIATGIIVAEQIEASQPEKAIALYAQLAEANTKQIHALIGQRGLFGNKTMMQALPEQDGQAPALPSVNIPTFRSILESLDEGDPMVIGYIMDTGEPVESAFDRLYSCGCFGLSGSGKTTGLKDVICQSLLTTPGIAFTVLDAHADRPESLTAGLPKIENFIHLDPFDFRSGLYGFSRELNARLGTKTDYSHKPYVLLIDELPVLIKSDQGKSLETLLGRIAAEGRKVGVYCLISGQDTRLKGAGSDRDLLCSSFVYNLKKKQARYLLDDDDLIKLHGKVRESKQKGLCLFNPTSDPAILIRQPYCTPADVQWVEQHMTRPPMVAVTDTVTSVDQHPEGNPPSDSPTVEPVAKDVEQPSTPVITSVESVQRLAEEIAKYLQMNAVSLSKFAERSGVNKGTLHQFLNGKGTLSEENQRRVLTVIMETTDITPPAPVLEFRDAPGTIN